MRASALSAPPVSSKVGRPEGKFTTPMSRQNTPCRKPVPRALAQASLAAKRLAYEAALDASDVDPVVAAPDDHHLPPTLASVALCRMASRAPSINDRMRATLLARP